MVREAIAKLYDMYQKIDRFKKITPGFGFFFKRYEVKGKVSFLLVVLEPPHFRTKGKLKDFEKVINRSLLNNKLILPKDFRFLHSYLSTDFNKLITPRDEILNKIKRIMASLRLNFFEDANMKYSLQSMFPEIIVFDTITDKGQFAFYFNIVNLSEDGLVLAHERQLNYLYEQIENGVNLVSLLDTDLPDLRSGNTAFSFSRDLDKQKSRDKRGSVKKFRQLVNKKVSKEDIEEELDYETVIDFNPKKGLDNKIKNDKKLVRRGLFGQPLPNISNNNEKILPKPISKAEPQLLENPLHPLDSSPPSIEDHTIITKQSNLAEINELEKKINILKQENVDLEDIKDKNDLLVNQITQITDELTTKLEAKDSELKNLKIKLEEEEKNKKGLEIEIQKIDQEKNVAFDGLEEQIQDLVDENTTLLKSLEEIEFKRKELELGLEEMKNARIKDEEINKKIIVALKEEIQILNRNINEGE